MRAPSTETSRPPADAARRPRRNARDGLERAFRLGGLLLVPALVVTAPWFLTQWADLGVIALEAGLLAIGSVLLLRTTAHKLKRALPKAPQRSPSREVAPNEIRAFGKQIEAASDQLSTGQLSLFAASILFPAAIRRRVSDYYSPSRRVIEYRVIMEFDFDPTLGPDAASGSGEIGERMPPPEDAKFVAIMLPEKGQLHDDFALTDGEGCTMSSLSYKEYRILAGLTMRNLLITACGSKVLTAEAQDLEFSYLELFLQYGIVGGDNGTQQKLDRVKVKLAELRAHIEKESLGKPEALDELARLIEIVATKYAVVAILPLESPTRTSVHFGWTEIPSLERRRARRLRAKLQLLLGAGAISLRVSAANSLTCQSYHLLVKATEDMYVGDFRAPFIQNHHDNQLTTDSRLTYHRLRGRRGQHYLHLYSRVAHPVGVRSEECQLEVDFYEVPPGSLSRAAISAVACLVSCLVVASTNFTEFGKIDGDIAAFLLAIPSIAAVWLGFETRHSHLLEGTLAARISLIGTFMMSMSAAVLLLLQKADHLDSGFGYSADRPHFAWLAIISIAAVNAVVTGAKYWERSRYYETVAKRSVGTSSVMLDT